MEQIYNISGTFDELRQILESDFRFSSDAARIAAAVLIMDQDSARQHIDAEEEGLWFLNDESSNYQTHIFSTRYTVSFTDVMVDILVSLPISGVMALVSSGKAEAVKDIIRGIIELVRHLRRIKDDECCVYFESLQYLKSHSGKWFSADDVMPDIGERKECIHLDKGWGCGFRCGNMYENCKMNVHDVKMILERLYGDGVMMRNQEQDLYKYKF